MKLRIRGNSIRLRLTQSEVGQIANGQSVEETTALAGSTLRYSLSSSDGAFLTASITDNHLAVSAPAAALVDWASGEAVTLDCDSGSDGSDILIEKDFACLTPRGGEDDTDTYPHPKEGSASC